MAFGQKCEMSNEARVLTLSELELQMLEMYWVCYSRMGNISSKIHTLHYPFQIPMEKHVPMKVCLLKCFRQNVKEKRLPNYH